jgi:hypothetical protein
MDEEVPWVKKAGERERERYLDFEVEDCLLRLKVAST